MIRKLFMIGFFSILLISVISAQPRMDPKERVKELNERLKLNEKQAKQIENIFIKQSEQFQKAFESGNGDREQRRDQMMKLREETNNKIEKVLNDKQKVEYKKYLKEMEERRQQRRPM